MGIKQNLVHVEFSTSAGPGTLLEHGIALIHEKNIDQWVFGIDNPISTFSKVLESSAVISELEAAEFVATHGGWVAT